MKLSKFILCLLIFTISCSSVNVIQDKFDNSRQFKIERSAGDFIRIDGEINIDIIILSKEFKNGTISNPKLFCKFECRNNEVFNGDSIELNIDSKIYKIAISENRLGKNQTIYHNYTQIGGFTFGSTEVTGLNIIVIEANINIEIQNALKNSKSMMLRIYTNNIDGISKNTFEAQEYTIKAIKELIQYMPEE